MRSRIFSGAALLCVALSGCGTEQAAGPIGATPTVTPTTASPTTTQPTSEHPSPTSVPLDADSPARPVCPSTIGTSPTLVPAKPTIGGTTDALVPDQVPSYAVVCSYPAGSNTEQTPTASSYRLQSSVQVKSGLEAIPDDLGHLMAGSGKNRPCTAMGGAQTQTLLGLQYARGVVWVANLAEPNNCSASSNGVFTTPTSLGREFTDAARTGVWKLTTPTNPCAGGSPGRAGADKQLVPGDPTGLVVCVESKAKPVPVDLQHRLQAAFGKLVTAPSQMYAQCSGAGKTAYLVFDYAVGPRVWIQVAPRCTPQVLSDGLQADSAGEVVQLLEQGGYLS